MSLALAAGPTPAPLVGATVPRLWTRPLVEGPPGPCDCECALSPATSEGFLAVEFANAIGDPLLPWQRWWLIHALELSRPGKFRFRTILTLVARQNGKTHVLRSLALYLMFSRANYTVLGTAQTISLAAESWELCISAVESHPELRAQLNRIRRQNGQQALVLRNGSRYRIAASNRKAARGMSIDCLVMDELREQRGWDAWAALTKTTNARPNALVVGISNAGDVSSVVLNSVRASGEAGADPSLALFEWSAPDGCDLDDLDALAQANPALGHTVSAEALLSAAKIDPPNLYRTEVLCQAVENLDGAFDLPAWSASADPTGDLSSSDGRIAVCVDVAPDGGHVSLIGAAMIDESRVRIEAFGGWDSVAQARRALPGILAQLAPAAVGWFPGGPAAALGTLMRSLDAVEITGSAVTESCMELAALADARSVRHPDDPMINAQVAGASRLNVGDGWRFARKGRAHVDACYAAAGAVRLAKTLPAPEPPRHLARIF